MNSWTPTLINYYVFREQCWILVRCLINSAAPSIICQTPNLNSNHQGQISTPRKSILYQVWFRSGLLSFMWALEWFSVEIGWVGFGFMTLNWKPAYYMCMASHLILSGTFCSLSPYGLDAVKNTSDKKFWCVFCFQGSPVEPGTGGPPTYGTDSGAPPSYDEATGWSL